MAWLASVAITLLHALYRLILIFKSLEFRLRTDPRPLGYTRSKVPSHLAVTFVPNSLADGEANEKYMLNSVEKVAAWCRVVGIPRVTVYDCEGILANSSMDIRERLLSSDQEDSLVECDIPYPFPLTPPPSDDADSRPLSPLSRTAVPKLSVTTIRLPTNPYRPTHSLNRTAVKRRRVPRNTGKADESSLILHIVSYKSGKPAIAAAATALLYDLRDNKDSSTPVCKQPSMQELNTILEGDYGLPSPDLMLAHRKPPAGQLRSPVELNGFPPWQMRLTEIYQNPYPVTGLWWSARSPRHNPECIEEVELRRALDEFADAEFRLGK